MSSLLLQEEQGKAEQQEAVSGDVIPKFPIASGLGGYFVPSPPSSPTFLTQARSAGPGRDVPAGLEVQLPKYLHCRSLSPSALQHRPQFVLQKAEESWDFCIPQDLGLAFRALTEQSNWGTPREAPNISLPAGFLLLGLQAKCKSGFRFVCSRAQTNKQGSPPH